MSAPFASGDHPRVAPGILRFSSSSPPSPPPWMWAILRAASAAANVDASAAAGSTITDAAALSRVMQINTVEQIAALVGRARAAQSRVDGWTQAQADMLALAAGWAIMEPARNRALAELAVRDTGLGNVDDKVTKNHRKTLGLLRDLRDARTVDVIAEHPERGVVEIARPVGVVAAITPSTNPGATPANKIINAVKCRNAIIVAPSPKGQSTAALLAEFMHRE